LNLITSAIARINMFMHNVDEFEIAQGDTLDSPQFLNNDALRQFDVVMANPPYSVKRWDQDKWMNDPYGRNIWGTPSQGCADYAFQQHIMASLKPDTGRCVVLFPHGVLFRDAESDIRKKMIEGDYVDAVIGLGSNLFYNATMESCLLVCRTKKPKQRRGKIIFINAVNEVRKERSNAWLEKEHINKIVEAYRSFKDVEGFAKVATINQALENNGNLSIPLYVKATNDTQQELLKDTLMEIRQNHEAINASMKSLFEQLEGLGIEE
jgi:type I restriction enzyme M protein